MLNQKITLAISTSAGQFAVILGDEDKNILYNSTKTSQSQELDDLLKAGLEKIGRVAQDISEIIIDVGPGGTSRVRTGIAFANALAYSLNIAVCPVKSSQIACLDIFLEYSMPSIFSVKSIKDNAYIAFHDRNNISDIRFGKINEIVPEFVKDIKEFVVIGAHRDEIINLESLKNYVIHDSGKLFGNAEILIKNIELFNKEKLIFPNFAQAVTEECL